MHKLFMIFWRNYRWVMFTVSIINLAIFAWSREWQFAYSAIDDLCFFVLLSCIVKQSDAHDALRKEHHVMVIQANNAEIYRQINRQLSEENKMLKDRILSLQLPLSAPRYDELR